MFHVGASGGSRAQPGPFLIFSYFPVFGLAFATGGYADLAVVYSALKRGQSIVWFVLLAKHQKLGLNIEPDTPTIARAMPTNIKTSVTF